MTLQQAGGAFGVVDIAAGRRKHALDLLGCFVLPVDNRHCLLAMFQAQFAGRPLFVTSGYRTQATNEH
jgi:hypothetical protein